MPSTQPKTARRQKKATEGRLAGEQSPAKSHTEIAESMRYLNTAPRLWVVSQIAKGNSKRANLLSVGASSLNFTVIQLRRSGIIKEELDSGDYKLDTQAIEKIADFFNGLLEIARQTSDR